MEFIKKLDSWLVNFLQCTNYAPKQILNKNNKVTVIGIRSGDRFPEKRDLSEISKISHTMTENKKKQCERAIGESFAKGLVISCQSDSPMGNLE